MCFTMPPSNLSTNILKVKVVTGKDGQAVTPVAIATQLPPNVSAAFSTQQQFQVIHLFFVLIVTKYSTHFCI